MSSRTSAQIQTELTLAYAARTAALLGQEYTLDTGQGRQSVTRANLTEINRTIQELEAELAEAGGAITHLEFDRSGA
jgi:hypothetical protein